MLLKSFMLRVYGGDKAAPRFAPAGPGPTSVEADFQILDNNDIENVDHLRMAFNDRGGSVGFSAWCDSNKISAIGAWLLCRHFEGERL